jgi:Glycosyltransferase family 87
MSPRAKALTAVCVCALHLALLVGELDGWSSTLELDFGPEAEAIESGEKPYGDQDLEYPPLSIPVIVGPALFTEDVGDYQRAFEWEMIGFDLAIVTLLSFGLGSDRRRVWGALATYTAGIVALSGVVLDESVIDAVPLALARFDLVPALLVLAAALAREGGRSATWSALLSVGAAVKAFPLLLYPALLRGERNPARVAAAAAIPIAAAAAIVLAFGDGFGSAISYHAERSLQVETVAATPFAIAHLLGAGASSEFGAGSFNLVASGADAARAISIALMVTGFALVLWAGWRRPERPGGHLELATALLAVVVVFSPVLSPQFLLWLLPISAAAYGLGRENLVLLGALVLTQLSLQYYAQAIDGLQAEFVWRIAARNLALLAYAFLVCAPIVREGFAKPQSGPSLRSWPEASST